MAEQDLFVRWAAAADGARVWRRPGAVVVACAALAHWDRLVLSGAPEALAGLLRDVLPEVGPTFRPFGPEDLVAAVVAEAPELELTARFAWMESSEPVGAGSGGALAGRGRVARGRGTARGVVSGLLRAPR
ncbi:hypothetical protein [Actinoplanes siamensis]|uniref:Uncharacterized protein n=1 Tax=Actinoplanes siamensis TaxID=1223317 RepID=A0A919NBL2_9ACTN|nr:hypothetical protein [Actinoplanes siamensis]GIF08157.1 hypothetical protein Asi03nite_56950 [Actinoplanes siamensis]